MDPIEHALDDFGRAIINRDNLPLTLHELAQAPTNDSDALDIETIGNLVDSVLWPLDGQGWPYLILVTEWHLKQYNWTLGCSKITNNRIIFKIDWNW